MELKSIAIIILCNAFLAPLASAQRLKNIITTPPFLNSWKLTEDLPLPRMEYLLQKFAAYHNKAFRHFGDVNDANHGHVLYSMNSDKIKPLAILYHTQEGAYTAHWESKDLRYDYINTGARNWLQLLNDDLNTDGDIILNARDFLRTENKDPNLFVDFGVPVLKEHFSLNSVDLDKEKIDGNLHIDLQFDFNAVDCASPAQLHPAERGPVHIALPNGDRLCLVISTASSSALGL